MSRRVEEAAHDIAEMKKESESPDEDAEFEAQIAGKWYGDIVRELCEFEKSTLEVWRRTFFTGEEWVDFLALFPGEPKPWVANCILSAVMPDAEYTGLSPLEEITAFQDD